MRVIYEVTEDCNKCPHNTGRVCMKLKKYLFDICFERDCPLPTLKDVEGFTRYITKDKGLRCSSDFCGVCGKEKFSWSNVYLKKG